MSAPSSLTASELKQFRAELLGWFATYQRNLPWRRDSDPYRIWISEIMLQQTRVVAVIPYFEKFCARFPEVRSLAEAEEAEVLRMWSGLGYYNRARNLQAAAQQIVREHGGTFPATEEHIRALRGIGKYTTNAILSIAFGEKHAVVEGNVARVVARLEAIRGDLREGPRWELLQRTADRLFGSDYRWSVLGAGRAQMPVASMAAAMGGNVRVGLEDSLWIGAGRMAESNAQQVRQVRKIIEGLGLEIATPDEAREILQLKGADKVAF